LIGSQEKPLTGGNIISSDTYYWFSICDHLIISCNCLAHIINLATQALISTYSKLPHFDLQNPEAYVPVTYNEVGLVWAIVIKVHILHKQIYLIAKL
jgi:hypothetical protein